jgi:hypothetical protein
MPEGNNFEHRNYAMDGAALGAAQAEMGNYDDEEKPKKKKKKKRKTVVNNGEQEKDDMTEPQENAPAIATADVGEPMYSRQLLRGDTNTTDDPTESSSQANYADDPDNQAEEAPIKKKKTKKKKNKAKDYDEVSSNIIFYNGDYFYEK